MSVWLRITNLFFLVSIITGTVWGQHQPSTVSFSNLHIDTFAAQTTPILLDTTPVFESSIKITTFYNQIIPDSLYAFNAPNLLLDSSVKDSIIIEYRTLPSSFAQTYQHKDKSLIRPIHDQVHVLGKGYTYNPQVTNYEAFQFKGLNYQGNFSRDISVGNAQDLISNSSFNLNVSGMLGEVKVTANLTDNTIPIQPEGNTQQLQDFDRIFIKLALQKHYLIAGDYDLKRPKKGYFVNYYRRLQGGQIHTESADNRKFKTFANASFAVSRGKFGRNTFQGEEGNQGPYRLTGNNGETFIVIIAGTERVFIDGQLLTRGADQDYVIDYNLSEIKFTNKQLITKDKRILVEFSYSDLNYLRSIFTTNAGVEYGRFQFHINYYTEQDAKNQSIDGQLDTTARAVLSQIGNATDQAFISGVSPATEGNPILYKLIDTVYNGTLFDSVYIFDPGSDSAIYNVRFSAVNTGGDYIRILDATNGFVYQWTPPDSLGQPTGTHAPIVAIIPPQKQQLLNVGMAFSIAKNAQLEADISLSNYDPNTFSRIDNSINQGLAARITYQHQFAIQQKKDSTSTTISTKAHYEYVEDNFTVVEPYRKREFQRDWNISATEQANEHLGKWQWQVANKKWGRISYTTNFLLRDTAYQGFKQAISADLRLGQFSIDGSASWLNAKTNTQSNQFWRPKLDISYTLPKLNQLKIGVYGEQEYNPQRNTETDTLTSTSFYYQLFKTYVELPMWKEQLHLNAFFTRRYDYAPLDSIFQQNTIADELKIGGGWRISALSNLNWNFHYRNLQVLDTALSDQTPTKTYLGRGEYSTKILKGLFRINTIYELGSGQQQKITYNYLEVDAGQGTYVWIDRDEDGVQEQNEFEIANFQDQANFIRVTILSGDFLRSHNVALTQNLSMNLKSLRYFKKEKNKHSKKHQKALKFAELWSTNSLLNIDRKTLAGADIQAFNPFQINVVDTSLVTLSSRIQNTLYFNRSGKIRFEFSQSDSRNKTLLTGGFDTRQRTEYRFSNLFNLRKSNPKKKNSWYPQLNSAICWGRTVNSSELFPQRDYDLNTIKIDGQFSLQYKNILRTAVSYNYQNKINQIDNFETALSHKITTEFRYNQLSKMEIRTSFSLAQLQYDGEINTPIAFAMTEGLLNGENYTWSVSFRRLLFQNFWLTLNYEGRKMGESNIVHVMRAQIRATF